MFERILVPVDGSANGYRAAEVAAQMAACHNSAIYLLHVIRDFALPREILQMIEAGEVTASRMQILQDSADIILDRAVALVKEAGVSQVSRDCIVGDPAKRILEYANQIQASLIVLGQHGLGEGGGLLGGVARKLVNMTNISCLVVTPRTARGGRETGRPE